MVIMLVKVNNNFMVEVPVNGGTLTEGIVGMPTLVNPVLALSPADKDVTSLVYSGLVRKDPNGNYIPDLASSYTISKDGLTYTFKIKKNIKFQDGAKINADDVVFTINKLKDPLIKSPYQSDWNGITVTKEDESTVKFILNQPYISFMDNMTVGILPKHVWENVSIPEFNLSSLNIDAIGSGPYEIQSVIKNGNGFPSEYILKRFNNFALGLPHIKYLKIISFANEQDLIKAMSSHSVDQAGGISPNNARILKKAGYTIHVTTLPRMFGIFFNSKNNPILGDESIIKAMDKVLDRQEIVNQVLNGYGKAIHDPIPDTIIPDDKRMQRYKTSDIATAENILESDGWTLGPDNIMTKPVKSKISEKADQTEKLSFSLATGNTPELKNATNIIKAQLALVGIKVNIKIYETGQLKQIIRSRGYEALFFGQVINHESDLFSFWHSSQITDPGLNIAMYNNKKVDNILDAVQKITDLDKRTKEYSEFRNQFDKDLPAIFIYSPKYLYATSKGLNNIYIDSLNDSSERFSSIYKWYANQEKVWKIFSK